MSDQAPESQETQVFCGREEFERLRDSPEFHRIMTLARIVNSIRFVEEAILTRGEAETPSATRQSSAAFFYLTALLYEGLNFSNRLGKHFRDSAAFRSGLVPLLKDPEIRELRNGILERLRNQAVYHHDDEVFPAGVDLLDEDEYVFASIQGTVAREGYYDLADIAVMRFALDAPANHREFAEKTGSTFLTVVRAAGRFAECADQLIHEYLVSTGWKLRLVPGAEPRTGV